MRRFIRFSLCIAFIFIHLSLVKAQVMGLELLKGEASKELDVKYTQGFIIVDVRFNNILPLKFIVDTGAEHIILFKKEISDIMGLQYGKKINLVGSDLEKEVYAYITRDVPLSLPKTPTVSRDIIVLEEDFLHLEELTGQPIHGILGSRFFRGLVLEIDYKKEKIIMHSSSDYELKGKGFKEIDIKIEQHKPYIASKIYQEDGSILDINLLLDTGSALPFLLFANTHPSLEVPENIMEGSLGKGLGGEVQGYLGKLDRLVLTKDFAFNNIITSFQKLDTTKINPQAYRHRNGLVGNPILERFELVLDYVHAKLYLKPRKNFNKDFEYDKSGLVIYAFGPRLDNFYVKQVMKGTPADKAGIKKGDLIRKVGIWPAGFYSLGGLLKKFKGKNGKTIKMVLERNGVKYKTSFKLEDFLSQDYLKNN